MKLLLGAAVASLAACSAPPKPSGISFFHCRADPVPKQAGGGDDHVEEILGLEGTNFYKYYAPIGLQPGCQDEGDTVCHATVTDASVVVTLTDRLTNFGSTVKFDRATNVYSMTLGSGAKMEGRCDAIADPRTAPTGSATP